MSTVHMGLWLPPLLLFYSFTSFFSGSFMRQVHCDRLRVDDTSSNYSILSSIQSVYGDVYDCIDVYKQPSLSHPALRGHKVKMKPSREILATHRYIVGMSMNHLVEFNFWKSKKGCPKGTVPIQRTKKMNEENNYSRNDLSHSSKRDDVLDFAGIHSNRGKVFYGATAFINIYNPKVYGPNQYSSAGIFLQTYEDEIRAGWTVNPGLYGDYRTRLYTAWTRDRYQSTGCDNTLCPGFVVVNNETPLGFAFDNISVIEGKQYEDFFYVHLEPGLGWWLFARDVFKGIGYWPISLFSTMQQNATKLIFGGQVYTPLSDNQSPEMGSGTFVNGQYDKTCYMRMVSTFDEDHAFVDVDNSYMNGVDSRCYYSGDNSFKNDNDRYSFVFGGSGGKDERTCLY